MKYQLLKHKGTIITRKKAIKTQTERFSKYILLLCIVFIKVEKERKEVAIISVRLPSH